MNILEKLKSMPMGTHLWSPAFGNIFLDQIDEDDQYPITIKYYNRTLNEWERDGLSIEGDFGDFDGAECIIFPSKQMTDWNRFFQPGDELQHVGGNQDAPAKLYFSRWVHDDYTTFIGRYCTESGYFAIYKAHTEDYRLAFKEDADRFLKASREQEQKATEQVSPFKPFDKVLARDVDGDKWQIDLFEQYDRPLLRPYCCMTGSYRQCIPYAGNEYLLGTTDSPTDKEAAQ